MVGNIDVSVSSVCFDSNQVKENNVFIAIKGIKYDGHLFIDQSVKDGARSVVCEILPEQFNEHVTYVKVNDSKKALGIISANFFNNPSHKLKLIGITGTNGKTTTATLLYKLFKKLGFKCALISTIKYLVDEEEINATHTTPDCIKLNELISKMVDAGCDYCFMEVSSHAVVQHRIAGLEFAGGVFTNITHDHLDYHGSFSEYIKAKKKFMDDLHSTSFALSNFDDKNGKVMFQNTNAVKYSMGLRNLCDFKAKVKENSFEGMLLEIDGEEVWFKLVGEFNAYNILSVYAVARLLGMEKMKILPAISDLSPVEGRFDVIRSDKKRTGVVDYAHTPDAVKNLLNTVKQICKSDQKIITVIGCGGDRDKSKRSEMAKYASDLSNKIILTYDNPRTEDPDKIIEDMKKGIPDKKMQDVLIIPDRKEAIKTACALANENDVIVLAGKGHEKYQEINGVKYPFDDKKILMELLNVKN